MNTPDHPTNITDFREFDSSIILILRGGIPRPTGDFPESLSQAISVGIMLVGGVGVRSVLTISIRGFQFEGLKSDFRICRIMCQTSHLSRIVCMQ